MPCSHDGHDTSFVRETLAEERPRFLEFVRRRVRRDDLAEDILQTAYARAFESADTLRERGAVQGWFFQILRRTLIDQQRKDASRGRVLEALIEELTPFELPVERTATACSCVASLEQELKPEYSTALRRIEVGGESVKGFAAAEGISAGTAAVRVHRARKALRKKVEATCGACASDGCLDCSCGFPSPVAETEV